MDPDNPPLVKGSVMELRTHDNVPIRDRLRKTSVLQQAFVTAKTNIMERQGKLEPSSSDYSSGLVLVPYEKRIAAFMDKHGDDFVDKKEFRSLLVILLFNRYP